MNVLQEAADLKDPEPANSEVSAHTITSMVNHTHVSEANLASRKIADSLSRDAIDATFLKFHFQCTLKE